MKKFISTGLAALILISAITACAPMPETKVSSASAEGIAKYTAYLEENLTEMPDSLVLATAENAETYGVDMTDFAADGYFTRAESGEVVILGKTDAGLDRAVRDFVKYGNDDDYFKVYNEGPRVKKLTIEGNDISEYAVILEDDADGEQVTASTELVTYIEIACGVKLPVFTASEYAAAADKPSRTISFADGNAELEDEGFTITVAEDGNLSIEGGIWRGCLYGVYDLLEDIGWRFVFGTTKSYMEYLYESEHVDLTADLNRTEIPSIPIRGGVGHLRRRDTYGTGGNPAYGGYGFTIRSCHGIQNNESIIFSGDYEGLFQWTGYEGMQPCFSDELIIEAIQVFAMNYVQSRLDAGLQIGRDLIAVDISQYDTGHWGFCQCETCRKVEREELSPCGAVLRMANSVAALLDENYPGMYVSILSYFGTDILPKKTRPLDNVYIAYCFYMGSGYAACGNHCISGDDCSVDSYASNYLPGKRFEEWAEAINPDNFQIWYYPYIQHTAAYATPIYTTLLDDIKYLASYGVGHIYLCSSTNCNGIITVSLAQYLCSIYAWDADITEEESYALMREWFNIVYGDAGEYLYDCMMISERAGDMAGCWCSYDYQYVDRVDYEFMGEHADEIWKLYGMAIKSADTEAQQILTEKYMAGMLYLAVVGVYDEQYTNGTEEERAWVAEMYTEMHGLFMKYKLPIYNHVLLENVYLPDELDLEVNPYKYLDDAKLV